MVMDTFWKFLAQTPPGRPATPGGMTLLLPAFLLAMVVFMLLSARSQKKREKRERETMFAGLARSDRVLTVGGIVGTVHSVKDGEVVLKVDESTNTKMTFVKTAIQRVLKDEETVETK